MRFIRFLYVLIYVSLLTLLSWLINGRSLIGIDDANIYFVYMRNFACGHGFVYNIGGERVEGFTSLLWTLIGSLFFFISKYPEKILLLVNVIIVSYVLFDISNYLEKSDKVNSSILSNKSLFFLAVIGVTPGFIDWTVLSLMETGLWCFLIVSLSLRVIKYELQNDIYKHYAVVNLFYILLILCRPESMLLVPFFILLNALKEYSVSKSIRVIIISFSISTIVYFTALLLLIYWRLEYFGYPLPNTYYAKVSGSKIDNIISGIKYIYSLFLQKPFIFFILIYSAGIIYKSIIHKKLLSNIPIHSLFFIMLVSLFIPLYSGGDHFGLHRFIMPFIPIIILLGFLILEGSFFFNSVMSMIIIFFLL